MNHFHIWLFRKLYKSEYRSSRLKVISFEFCGFLVNSFLEYTCEGPLRTVNQRSYTSVNKPYKNRCIFRKILEMESYLVKLQVKAFQKQDFIADVFRWDLQNLHISYFIKQLRQSVSAESLNWIWWILSVKNPRSVFRTLSSI